MLCEGIGIRAASRLTGLHVDTVLNILATAGEHCARLLESKVRGVSVEQVEVDELHGFVFSKQQNTPAEQAERGDQFTFLAIERRSKLVLGHLVGKRTQENCRELLRQVKTRTTGRVALSTDGFSGYPPAVWQLFRDEIDYGTEVKHFNCKPGLRRYMPVFRPDFPKCDWVRRTAIRGNPILSEVNTSHAERLNLSCRLFNRRLTRHTLGYSKTLSNLRHSMSLFVAFYNFCRVHSAHKQTPAQAAGLTDRAWTVEELLGGL